MTNRSLVALLMACIALPCSVAAKQKKPAAPVKPIGWLSLQAGARKFSVSEEDFQKLTRQLPQGMLLPVFKTKEKHGATLARVAALNLETGNSELGWVEINLKEVKPADSFPPDDELLRLLGSPYLDDFTADHTDIARFLVRQAQGRPALLCYVLTAPLSMAKLVIFSPRQGRLAPTAALNITIGEMQAGITSIEVRDLVGNGTDCVITKENFREEAQTSGRTLRIRRIVDGRFEDLWQAPLEFQNLSQYNPKMQILQPAVQNIGAPGTVTTGDVTFRPNGAGQEPVWKGKVEFFVFGRDKAVDSVNIEKACPWNGRRFAPLR
jgi:hypothetical protein